jgi:hypothetical protein
MKKIIQAMLFDIEVDPLADPLTSETEDYEMLE